MPYTPHYNAQRAEQKEEKPSAHHAKVASHLQKLDQKQKIESDELAQKVTEIYERLRTKYQRLAHEAIKAGAAYETDFDEKDFQRSAQAQMKRHLISSAIAQVIDKPEQPFTLTDFLASQGKIKITEAKHAQVIKHGATITHTQKAGELLTDKSTTRHLLDCLEALSKNQPMPEASRIQKVRWGMQKLMR